VCACDFVAILHDIRSLAADAEDVRGTALVEDGSWKALQVALNSRIERRWVVLTSTDNLFSSPQLSMKVGMLM
jgi:hypothetical protein